MAVAKVAVKEVGAVVAVAARRWVRNGWRRVGADACAAAGGYDIRVRYLKDGKMQGEEVELKRFKLDPISLIHV